MQDGSSKGPVVIPIVGDRGYRGEPGATGAQVGLKYLPQAPS